MAYEGEMKEGEPVVKGTFKMWGWGSRSMWGLGSRSTVGLR
jgi:hypothetical protein